MKYKATSVHCGQYKRYGDFFRVWEIETENEDEEAVLNFCFENLYKGKVPSESEWRVAIKYGTGEKSGDAAYYFAGYYKLERIEKGYKFTICEPYCD